MIALNRVRPGDILLVAFDTPSSKRIRRATLGRYSHAAIFITNKTLFESIGAGKEKTDEKKKEDSEDFENFTELEFNEDGSIKHSIGSGLGFTTLEIEKVATANGEIEVLASYPEAIRYKVLRHRNLEPPLQPYEQLAASLMDEASLRFGKKYPHPSDLLNVYPFLKKRPKTISAAYKASSKMGIKEITHYDLMGDYCSKVALSLLERIGAKVDSILENDTHPSRLPKLDEFFEVDCTPSADGITTDWTEKLFYKFARSEDMFWAHQGRRFFISELVEKFYPETYFSTVAAQGSKDIIKAGLRATPNPKVDETFMLDIMRASYLHWISVCLNLEWRVWAKFLKQYEDTDPFPSLATSNEESR